MKLLYTSYPSLKMYGGGERSMFELAKGLKKYTGIKDIIFASNGNFPGFKTYVFKDIRKIPIIEYRNTYLHNFFNNIIKEEKIDIIHSHDIYTPIAAIKTGIKNKIPTVVHYRGYWFICPRSTLMRPDFTLCERCSYSRLLSCDKTRILQNTYKLKKIITYMKILQKADISISISNFVKQKLKEVEIDSIVIPNPVDTKKFNLVKKYHARKKYNIPLESFVITYIGSLEIHKGVLILKKIIDKFVNTTNFVSNQKRIIFIIVGSGSFSSIFRGIAKKYDNVLYLGRVKDYEIPYIYKLSDIILFPSQWYEPFGRIVIESMASKRTVIASKIGGVQDIIENFKNGVFVENPSNVDEWIEKIRFIYNEHKTRKMIEKKALKSAKKYYDISVISKKMYKIYKKL